MIILRPLTQMMLKDWLTNTIENRNPEWNYLGICDQFPSNRDPYLRHWLMQNWKDWEYYTGSDYYPIPARRKNLSKEAARIRYHDTNVENSHYGHHEYGDLRIDLCSHLLGKLP